MRTDNMLDHVPITDLCAIIIAIAPPRSTCIAVEEQVRADPVPAVVASLRGHRCHLHLLPEVQLEPRLLVARHWRPAAGP